MAETKAPHFSSTDIISLLPHRFPFLLVDVVKTVEVPNPGSRIGRKAIAIKNVTINEPFFPGHFPHRPVMPGVLQIEALAQVAALACVERSMPKCDVAIAGIDKARFRRPVVPGDQLELTAEVVKDRSSLLFLKCEARVGGEIVCEADIMAKIFLIEASH